MAARQIGITADKMSQADVGGCSEEGGELTQDPDSDAAAELLKPAPDDYLQTWPVARRVNSSRAPNNDPTLIHRVAA